MEVLVSRELSKPDTGDCDYDRILKSIILITRLSSLWIY